MPDKERGEIIRRLCAINNEIFCLQKMIESDRPCGQILHETYKIQGELRAIKVLLLKCQLTASQNIIQSELPANIRLVEFQRLSDLLIAINQSV